MNLIEGLQSGIYGIILVVVFYVLMSPLVVVDKMILKNDGVAALSMNAVAGVSASFPAIVAQVNPGLESYVTSATTQIVTLAIITILVTPMLARKLYQQTHKINSK